MKSLLKAIILSIISPMIAESLWMSFIYNIYPISIITSFFGLDLSTYKPEVRVTHPIPIPYGKNLVIAISIVLITSLIPATIYCRRRWKELVMLKEELYGLMRGLSGFTKTGVGLSTTLETLAGIAKPPLSDRLRLFSSLLSLGYVPDEAFKRAFGDLPRDLRSIFYTIVIALQSGGRAPEIIDYAAGFTADTRAFEEVREGRLSQYIYIVLLACVAFSLSSVVMIKMLESVAVTGAPILRTGSINIELFYTLYYYASLIIAAFSSITIGRTLKGYTPISTYYALLMITLSSIIFIAIPVLIKF